jgi:hypothetical protein
VPADAVGSSAIDRSITSRAVVGGADGASFSPAGGDAIAEPGDTAIVIATTAPAATSVRTNILLMGMSVTLGQAGAPWHGRQGFLCAWGRPPGRPDTRCCRTQQTLSSAPWQRPFGGTTLRP